MDYKTFKYAIDNKSNELYEYSNVVILVNGIEYDVEEVEFSSSFIRGKRVIISTQERE